MDIWGSRGGRSGDASLSLLEKSWRLLKTLLPRWAITGGGGGARGQEEPQVLGPAVFPLLSTVSQTGLALQPSYHSQALKPPARGRKWPSAPREASAKTLPVGICISPGTRWRPRKSRPGSHPPLGVLRGLAPPARALGGPLAVSVGLPAAGRQPGFLADACSHRPGSVRRLSAPPVPSGEESRPGARRDFGGAARPTRRLPWGWAPPLVSDGKAAPPLADGPPPPGRESQGCPAASRETGARPAALGTRSEAPPSPVPRLRGGRAERRAGPWAGLARGGSGSGSGSEASMGARRVQPPASPTWSSG